MTQLSGEKQQASEELVRRLREAGTPVTDSRWQWNEDALRWEFALVSPAAVPDYRTAYEAVVRALPDGLFADEVCVRRPPAAAKQ